MVNNVILMPHVTRNSGNNEWYTPAPIIEAAREVMGSIDCDPATCEAANRWIKAPLIYTAETNGLENPWRGNVWLNPPYSRDLLPAFAEAVCEKWMDGEIDQAIVLVNNATETAAVQRMLKDCAAVCLIRGRIAFWDETGVPAKKPLQGQIALYFGDDPGQFIAVFSKIGVTR